MRACHRSLPIIAALLSRKLTEAKPYGQTALFDGLLLALDTMDNARYQKKALLLITDGIDNASKGTLAQVLERVKREHVMVFAIGLTQRVRWSCRRRRLSISNRPGQWRPRLLSEYSGRRAYHDGHHCQGSPGAIHARLPPIKCSSEWNVAIRPSGHHAAKGIPAAVLARTTATDTTLPTNSRRTRTRQSPLGLPDLEEHWLRVLRAESSPPAGG